jgi:glutamine amidotransferase
MRILIIDLDSGNLNAVKNILESNNFDVHINNDYKVFSQYDAYIIPGVSSFDFLINKIEQFNLSDVLKDIFFMNRKIIFGICSGMQIFFESSEEGVKRGLGLIEGKIFKFKNIKLPHVGWNEVNFKNKEFHSLKPMNKFYFNHSYYPICPEEYILGETSYGLNFPSIIKKNNFVGVQFHPEKSHLEGINFINFILKKHVI